MEKIKLSNRFILHPQFNNRIQGIKNDIKLPLEASTILINNDDSLQKDGNLSIIGEMGKKSLNALNGRNYFKSLNFLAYDESIDKFQALEGSGYVTCHSIVLLENDDYIASNCLSFAFYTRSKKLLEKNNTFKKVDSTLMSEEQSEEFAESAYNRDYAIERTKFILNNCPDNSILLIDGPLIGKQMSDYTVKLNNKLLEKSIIPIFIVKNSQSNLVTDNIQSLKGTYNSDMHWAYNYLSNGERTNFFIYQDSRNKNFSKVFCYIKPFDVSPQRIEIHPLTYEGREEIIENLMDSLYYFYLSQGDLKNPQVRPVAIAEIFARETKKMYNINKLLKESKIQPTMNQARGFR